MIRLLPAFALVCGTAPPLYAHAADTLLTVEVGGVLHHYDLAELMALPVADFTTTTPWTDGPQHFTGVPVSALLDDAGIADGAIHATAVNDYAVTLEVEAVRPDAEGDGPIIAYLTNGSQMSLRDKGPLWLVWPYDAGPEYRAEVVYAGSIWQLERIQHVPAAE